MNMNPRSQRVVDSLRSEIPRLVAEVLDYGFTVAVMNPETMRAIYVSRVLRDEEGNRTKIIPADESPEWKEIAVERLQTPLRQLDEVEAAKAGTRQDANASEPRPGHRNSGVKSSGY
jgi:hypothetical protein